MFDLDTDKIYLKGFARQTDERDTQDQPCNMRKPFYAIITNMILTDEIEVVEAQEVSVGTWMLKCADGKIRTFEKEPRDPREMSCGELIANYRRDFLGREHYQVISHEWYGGVAYNISRGDRSYRLHGDVKGVCVVTSTISRLWMTPDGVKHAITTSGSYYTF